MQNTLTAPPIRDENFSKPPPMPSGDSNSSSEENNKLDSKYMSADEMIENSIPRAMPHVVTDVPSSPSSTDEHDGSMHPDDTVDFSAVSKTLKTSWSGDVGDSIFPIVTAYSKGAPMEFLVDNCNDSTLSTRDLVNKLRLKVYKGKATTIAGVGDVHNLKTSSYAYLNVSIDANHFRFS